MTNAHARMFAPESRTGPSPHLPYPDEGDGGGGTPATGTGTEGDGEEGKPSADAEGQPEPDWKTQSRTWEKRAKADAREADKLRAELDRLRQAQMSEAEKAIDNARAEGEKAGLVKASGLLVKARLEAALAHLDDDARDALIEGVDVKRFVGDDATPNADAIKTWAERVAPKKNSANQGFPDLGAGRRQLSPPTDMNSLIRLQARR